MTPFRHATPADLPAVLALLKDSGLPYQDVDADRIRHFVIAAGGQSLLGTVGIEIYGKDALLRSLVVRPESRWTGLGSQLTSAMEQHAQQAGVSTIYLLTMTAEPFFARRGYVAVSRKEAPPALQGTAEFAGLCPSQAVCMRRSLT